MKQVMEFRPIVRNGKLVGRNRIFFDELLCDMRIKSVFRSFGASIARCNHLAKRETF